MHELLPRSHMSVTPTKVDVYVVLTIDVQYGKVSRTRTWIHTPAPGMMAQLDA